MAATSKTSCGLTEDTEQANVAPQTNVDSERGENAPKKGEHSDLQKDNVCMDLKKSPVETEDTNMDEPPNDMEVEESTNTNISDAGNFSASSADDLDEMMDIGTVDQVDQEAQMKEQSKSLEGANAQTSAVSNSGTVKQSCFFLLIKEKYLCLFSDGVIFVTICFTCSLACIYE